MIFDLGGVLLDLHLDRTHEAFAHLGRTSVSEIRAQIEASTFFNRYEKGELSDRQFREEVRRFLGQQVDDPEIDRAWNAMLGAIPSNRLRMLRDLQPQYRIFLLSNTNQIHLDFFGKQVLQTEGVSLDDFFEKAYYSHVLKMRKPEQEIFDYVLRENRLVASETLFLDDNLSNLEGAARTGIKTFHVLDPSALNSLFS